MKFIAESEFPLTGEWNFSLILLLKIGASQIDIKESLNDFLQAFSIGFFDFFWKY